MTVWADTAEAKARYLALAKEAWFDGFRARAEGNHKLARRLISKSGRLASVARRLDWIPEVGAHG